MTNHSFDTKYYQRILPESKSATGIDNGLTDSPLPYIYLMKDKDPAIHRLPAPDITPEVTVCMITYNQEKYVAQAVDSILSQQTDFNFELLIHDDNSSDGTVEILKDYACRYPQKIRLILESHNQYSQNRKILGQVMYPAISGRYVAFNEGDDFWSDPQKLQKQYDYMEQHEDCSMCCHAAIMVNADDQSPIAVQRGKTPEAVQYYDIKTAEAISWGDKIPTNSYFFRTTYIQNGFPDFYNQCHVGDYPMILYFTVMGRVHFLADIMSAYRVNAEGSWTNRTILNPSAHIQSNLMIIDMLYQFDKWSNGECHPAVKKRINEFEFENHMKRHNLKALKKEPYRSYYRDLPFKNRLRFKTAAYFPCLYKLKRLMDSRSH